MYFSQNLDNIWTTSIKILSKQFRKFTDSTLKSKQFTYFIINMLYNIITPSKTPYSAGKYVILPNPNRITKRKAKRRQQKDKSYKINILWDFFLLPFGDLDRQKEGIDGQKLVPNSYPRQDFQKRGTICRILAEHCRDLATLHLSHYELIKVVL